MKKIILAALALASCSAFAGQHTITGGYASTDAEGDALKGINVKYAFQPEDSRIGVIAALSVTGRTDEYSEPGYSAKLETGYGSLQAGVTYAATDWLKPYVTAGVSRGAMKYTEKEVGYEDFSVEETRTGFVYGVGVQVTPVKGFTFDAGVERTKLFETNVTTWTIGAGYRF